jgi:hypothetical protein
MRSGGTQSSVCGRALRREDDAELPASLRRRGGQPEEVEAASGTEVREDVAVEAGVADVAADGGGRGPLTTLCSILRQYEIRVKKKFESKLTIVFFLTFLLLLFLLFSVLHLFFNFPQSN